MSFFIGIPEKINLSLKTKKWLCSKKTAGVILFKRNFENKNQLKNLCSEIKLLNKDLLIGVDQEGGPVQRFLLDFTKLKSSEEIGEAYKKSPSLGLKLAQERGLTMARELKEVGVDISFAPVIDLSHPESNVLHGRTYHEDPHVVAELALAEISAMESLGLIPVIKHFPGHGGVSTDTHLEAAHDLRTLEKIEEQDLKPFKICIEKNIKSLMPLMPLMPLMSIMASWVIYPKIDPLPVCFSQRWLKVILREKLKFRGKIFTDDFGMQAAKYFNNPIKGIEKAQEAGCDYILLCNDFELIDLLCR